MKRLLWIAIALIVYGSLYPWTFRFGAAQPPWEIVLESSWSVVDRFFLRDIALNILLYVPLGVVAFSALAERYPGAAAAALAVLIGFSLSAVMEMLQVYVPGRDPSLLDVTTNTLGTVVGTVLGWVLQPEIAWLWVRRSRPAAGAAVLLLATWAAFQLYPFFPALSLTHLGWALEHFAAGGFSAAEVWASGAEWLAAGLAVHALWGRLRAWELALPMGTLAARFAIATRGVTLNEVAGAVLALLVWVAVGERRRLTAGLCAISLAVLLRELEPFRWSAAAAPFNWIPFVPTFDSEREGAVVILARKAFDYGAAIWLWRRAGTPYARATATVAVALFGLELLQRHLPGRTPEVTDSVVAGLMGLALWICDTRRPGKVARR